MTTMVRRTTLLVRDLDASLAFYRDVLGLDVYYDNEITLTGELLPAGDKGDVTRLVIVRGEDPVIGMIGLLQWIDPVKPAPPVDHTVGYGNPIFVLAVDDAAATHDRAKAHGCTIRAPLSETEYPGADGGVVRVRSVGLFDPDGHFFECNQRLEG